MFIKNNCDSMKMFSMYDHQNYDKLCRTCLQTNENMMSLFKTEILNMLSVCTTINIDEDDRFPNQICTICLQKATDAYNFHKQCENSDQILRETQLNNKIEQNTRCEKLIKQETTIDEQKSIELISPAANELFSDDDADDDDIKSETVNEVISTDGLTCPECGKQFRFPCELTRHRWIHKDPSFQCHKCDKKFKMKDWLDRHMKICHNGDRLLQICKICGKSVLHLEQHNLIHNNEKFTCTVCSMDFTNKCALRAHITRKHGRNMDRNQYKPYLCSICGLTTYTITALKSHMTAHTTERKYTCTVCSKQFKTVAHRTKHMKFTHDAIKRVQCHLCTKAFCSRTVLKLHLRVHTGERPYRCHVCAKTFSQSSSLRTHMKIHGTSCTTVKASSVANS